jgi:hypothetical protein
MSPLWHGQCEHGCKGAQSIFFGLLAVVFITLAIALTVPSAKLMLILTVASALVALIARPMNGGHEHCERCNSIFVDTWHRLLQEPVFITKDDPWYTQAARSMLVTHCRRCGHEKEKLSIYFSTTS